MNKVYACLTEPAHTDAVIDWSAWAARRLDAPLEFLHVLERHPERSSSHDCSGAIGVDAQAELLQQLSDADEQHSLRAREAGWRLLANARARAAAAGIALLDGRLRHGEFVETVLEMAPDARLIVLGEHHPASLAGGLSIALPAERLIRTVSVPVLVASDQDFAEPLRAVIAFDGSAAARRTVEAAATSPLLAGFPVLLALVGPATPRAHRRLDEARDLLLEAGRAAEVDRVGGEWLATLAQRVKAQGPALLVMGGFAPSRLRQLIVGRSSAMLLRRAHMPVLILR